jgi:hypothetical protein
MPSYICGFPDLDRGFSSRADPEEVDCARTRRLAAKLFRVVRPFLAIHARRLNAYIALDAVAWAAARIIAGTEGRNALGFFTLALTQNLSRLENSEIATDADPLPPGSKASYHGRLACRSVAEHLLEDIAMPRKLRAIIADRLEVALLEAMARGRRLARISMQTKKRKKDDPRTLSGAKSELRCPVSSEVSRASPIIWRSGVAATQTIVLKSSSIEGPTAKS